MHLPEGVAHLDSFSSQAACGSSRQRTASSLSSVDQTAHFFLATPNPRRPWQKQVRACGRKRAITTTTHYPQTAGETAGMHENGSGVPRLFGTGGSDLERSALHRSTRDATALASRALPPLLEAQVKGLFSQTEGRRRNDCLDQADG